MSENVKLSQEEIDALLKGANSSVSNEPIAGFSLNEDQKDALGELGNISFGSAATSLSTLLAQRVDITTPTVNVIHSSDVQNAFPKPYVMVTVKFTEGLKGFNAFAIEMNDAKIIADLMLGGDGTNVSGELNELHLSAVGEAMNQMMGGASTSMSQIFGRTVNISPPMVKVVDLSATNALELGLKGWIANVEFRLKVGTLIDSQIMQLLPAEFAIEMLEALGINGSNPTPKTPDSIEAVSPAMSNPPQGVKMNHEHMPPEAKLDLRPEVVSEQSRHIKHEPQQQIQSTAPVLQGFQSQQVQHMPVQHPEFADFSHDVQVSGMLPRNLTLLLDVPLNVTVELGRARKAIRDILDLTPGAILELDKLAGEPVDILVNNKRIAIGEVVVIDENFGVRVTDIVSPNERIKTLQ